MCGIPTYFIHSLHNPLPIPLPPSWHVYKCSLVPMCLLKTSIVSIPLCVYVYVYMYVCEYEYVCVYVHVYEYFQKAMYQNSNEFTPWVTSYTIFTLFLPFWFPTGLLYQCYKLGGERKEGRKAKFELKLIILLTLKMGGGGHGSIVGQQQFKENILTSPSVSGIYHLTAESC